MKIRNGFLLGLAGGLGVLLALAIGTAVQQISTVLVWAFAGIFLALGVEPVIQFLIRRKVPRWAAVLLIFSAMTMVMIPHPTWFMVAAVVLIAAAGWLAGRLGGKVAA